MENREHLRRINPSNKRRPRKNEVVSESCHYGWYSFPMRPEPATAAVSTQFVEPKKQAVA